MAGISDNGRIKIDSFNHIFQGQFLKGERESFTVRVSWFGRCRGWIVLADNSSKTFEYDEEEYKFVFGYWPTELEWRKGKNF